MCPTSFSRQLLLISLLTLRSAEAINDDEWCSVDENTPDQGHVLFQARRIKSNVPINEHMEIVESVAEAEQAFIKAVIASDGIGATAALTEDGYKQVFESCCNLEMAAFTKRVIDSMGLEVCDIGGLGGMVPWYTCESNASTKPQSLATLKDNLLKSQPPTKCAFVAPAGSCLPKDTDCKGEIGHDSYGDCESKSAVSSPLAPTPGPSTTLAPTPGATSTPAPSPEPSTTPMPTTTTPGETSTPAPTPEPTTTPMPTTTTPGTTSTLAPTPEPTTTPMPTTIPESTTTTKCITPMQFGTRKSLGSYNGIKEVFEWLNSEVWITNNHKHTRDVCCIDLEPGDQVYKCKVRVMGEHTVPKAHCCNCNAASPLTATRTSMFKPRKEQAYACYYQCEEATCA